MKRIYSFFIATIALLLCGSKVSAHDFELNGIYYNITSSTTVEVTYKGSSYNEYTGEYSGSITIPAMVTYNGVDYSVTSIEDYAFHWCGSLTDVYCFAEEVPTTQTDAFNNSNIGNATLHVPASALNAYKTTAPWSSFGKFESTNNGGSQEIEVPRAQGIWTFDDADDVLANSGGVEHILTPGVIEGQSVFATTLEGAGIEQVEGPAEGNKAIFLPMASMLDLEYATPYDEKVKNYTIMYDLRVSKIDFNALLQPNLENNSDAMFFIERWGGIGHYASGNWGYGGEIVVNTWHRVVITVADGVPNAYLDGELVVPGKNDFYGVWLLDPERTFLFCDNDGERINTEVAEIRFWNVPLTDSEVATLGKVSGLFNKEYLITYVVDGEIYHSESLPYGASITAPEPPTKEGYTFVGWEGLPETMPSENITVTANFVKNNPVDIPAKNGEWLFDNPNNLYLCTEGSIDLIPYKVGANNTAPTTWGEGEDTGIEKTAEGIYMPKSTCLFMNLNEGDKVRNYTLIYDLRLKDVTSYTGLLQTDLNNNSDSRLFITQGKLGVNAGGLGYGGEVIANQWHRVTIVVEDGIVSTYIDGLHIGTSQNTRNDFWCLDKEGVFLFLDNDRESTDVEVAGVHFWKQVLSEEQIEVLGGEENMNDSKEYSLNFSKSANVVRTDRLLQSIAVSDDSGDVKTITVDVTKPYVSKVYDEGSTLICKVGVPLTVTFDCQGSGLNSYVYIDLEDDKQFSFNEGQTDQSGTDVMAYSFYSGSFDDDSEGVNSAGDVLTGDSRYTMICPTFNAPTEAGVYRIRFKTDWNSIDAGGQLAADGTCTGTNGFLANGGTIVDATLRVLGDFTVTYMVDGKVYHTEKVGYKDLISLPEPPTKEGYTFKEWDGIPETMPGNDITITGVFTANNYQITYMLDGEVYYTDSVACGTQIPTVTPTKEGHTFNGWEGLPETMPAHDLVIDGSFRVNNYTITYKVDGESYKTTRYAYCDTIVVEAEPQKEGYTFSGWDEIPETMPANHITISGTFIINDYQITYMVDGEQYYSDFITYKEKIIPIDSPTKEGHTFNGWEGLPETMPAHDLVINGSFTVNSYTITYMLDGKVYKTVTYNYGDTIVPEESPSTTGYVFSGWLGLPETMPAEDLIIVGVLAALDGNYTDDQGVQYTLEDNKEGYAVSGISKSAASDIVIPAEVNDLPVTVIGERAFIAVENMQSVVIPSNITTVGKNVFYGCKNLLLVEWNTTAPVRADCFDKAENHGNMLVFVNDADTEVSYKGNVIVEGAAEQITISDDMAFRSPQQFTARNISFTRNFDKKTKIGVSGGWESMVLPFDVQSVVSKNRGELKPFGEADFTTSLPYWLGELQADGTFATTQRITANKPFIMQLPNSDEYRDIYNVEGEVTFSATDVTVYPTTDMEQEVGNGYVMLGNYEGTTADSHVYALNDEEYTADGETYMPGSIFVANARDIRPFEAYVYTTNAGRAPYLRVGNAGETGIGHSTFNVQHSTEIYDLTGRKVLNTETLKGGVYIVNGKKVIFK